MTKSLRRVYQFFGFCLPLLTLWSPQARAETVLGEARQAGRTIATFPAVDENSFSAMDGEIALSLDEVKSRNVILASRGNT